MSDDSEVAFWTGILGQKFLSIFRSTSNLTIYIVSMFFLTQFLTSLLWVRIIFSYLCHNAAYTLFIGYCRRKAWSTCGACTVTIR